MEKDKSTKRFISPALIYARVKEEMRSYFNTGAIDDLLFPIWTKDCIDKFEYTYLPLHEAILDMYDHKCTLPCDFKSVREVWVCATIDKGPIMSPHVFYYQTDCRITPQSSAGCSECIDGYQCFPNCQTPKEVGLPSLCEVPDEYIVTHKVMNQMLFRYNVVQMLKPGNFRTISRCHTDCPNVDIYAIDTFDIMGDKLITSFATGTVYLAYYATHEIVPSDEGSDAGYYMIPDNEPFGKYLYFYLRYMVYQQLFDQSTEETFQQMRFKRDDAEDKMNNAYINAKTYAVSDNIYGVQKSIIRSYNRNNRFNIK
jgi:hypothetical protein